MGMGILESRRTCGNPVGMETNIAGLLPVWNNIVRDSRWNAPLFDFYGAPTATEICFQTAEDCVL